ncbi:hypothetical protein ABPG73_022771, partial [Tetrahymena malaccensis]
EVLIVQLKESNFSQKQEIQKQEEKLKIKQEKPQLQEVLIAQLKESNFQQKQEIEKFSNKNEPNDQQIKQK